MKTKIFGYIVLITTAFLPIELIVFSLSSCKGRSSDEPPQGIYKLEMTHDDSVKEKFHITDSVKLNGSDYYVESDGAGGEPRLVPKFTKTK
jgi:hypothetical protein